MTMLKQLPSRNQRSKGFKIKHFLQACLLLAICIWLLNQFKHLYEKKTREDGAGVMNEVLNEPEGIKLGRKDLHHRIDGTASEVGRHEGNGEVEESPAEDNEDEGRGGGDDEIDGRYQEKAEEEETEEVEDLIDVEDKEKEEESDEQEDDVKGYQNEDQTENEGGGNSREAREEHYKGDDASSAVEQQRHTQTMSTGFQIGGMRKVKQEDTENLENMEPEQESENHNTKEDIVNVNESGLELESSAVHSEEKSYFNSANSDVGTYSDSSTKLEVKGNEKVNIGSISVLKGTSASSSGPSIILQRGQVENVTSIEGDTFSAAVLVEPSRSYLRNIENEKSLSNTSFPTSELDAAPGGWMVFNTSESVVPEWMKNFKNRQEDSDVESSASVRNDDSDSI